MVVQSRGISALCCRGLLGAVALLLVSENQVAVAGKEAGRSPNIVLILCDNLGYGDIGCYGSTLHRTPHVDLMATEGMKCSAFYVASGVCTPSRAAIMTGCYPRRVNLHVPDNAGRVLQPVSPKGLHPDELTVAEVLRSAGYVTAIIGKWHLGDQLEFLPTRQGFDSFLGVPYSDDMTPREGKPWPPLPLMRDEQVIDSGVDRNTLTKRYTEAAVEFIEANRDRPFFLYLPHAMPGSTQEPFASEAFRGKSANGAYGDSVEELDWSTGEILKAIRDEGLDDRTLVIWTSDNGAPRRNPPQGSNLPLKGWGYDCSEGAMRMPCVLRWPGVIPSASQCAETWTAMDFLPTFASLAGASLPENLVIDGRDVQSLWKGVPESKSPHRAVYFYFGEQLQAVRSGPWKLYLPLESKLGGATRKAFAGELYQLEEDVSEERNVFDEHPEVVARLMRYAEEARDELGDEARPGRGQRDAGWVTAPTARLPE